MITIKKNSKKQIFLLYLLLNPAIIFADTLKKQLPTTNVAYQDELISGQKGPVLIPLKPGHFTMGDQQNNGQSYEKPLHAVTIDYAFSIGKYPITFDEFDLFTQATGRPLASSYKWGRGDRPVINVNREDVVAYVKWLSKQTQQHYRLPSEAEWEYASRANTTSTYPWGKEIGHNLANCHGCGSKWDRQKTSPVGQFPANNWGLHDTQGNVWEITADCWNYNYDQAPINGDAWRTGDCTRIVLRGGSWGDTPADNRSATRLRSYEKTRTVNIGFRVVRQ